MSKSLDFSHYGIFLHLLGLNTGENGCDRELLQNLLFPFVFINVLFIPVLTRLLDKRHVCCCMFCDHTTGSLTIPSAGRGQVLEDTADTLHQLLLAVTCVLW